MIFSPEHSIVVKRVLHASPERVYAAWTEPARLRDWFGQTVEADVRVGGAYRVENPSDDGGVWAHVGEFLVLEPSRRIVMSFAFDGPEGEAYTDEFIEIILEPLADGRTALTLTNGWNGKGYPPEEVAGVDAGWNQWLDLLEKSLS